MRRQRLGALMTAGTAAGEDRAQFPHKIAQLFRGQAGRRQTRFFICVNVVSETRMRSARRQRDMRLAVAYQNDARRRRNRWHICGQTESFGYCGKDLTRPDPIQKPLTSKARCTPIRPCA
jgi:hypothetical protein